MWLPSTPGGDKRRPHRHPRPPDPALACFLAGQPCGGLDPILATVRNHTLGMRAKRPRHPELEVTSLSPSLELTQIGMAGSSRRCYLPAWSCSAPQPPFWPRAQFSTRGTFYPSSLQTHSIVIRNHADINFFHHALHSTTVNPSRSTDSRYSFPHARRGINQSSRGRRRRSRCPISQCSLEPSLWRARRTPHNQLTLPHIASHCLSFQSTETYRTHPSQHRPTLGSSCSCWRPTAMRPQPQRLGPNPNPVPNPN